jgi:L-ascorbate metabolism protein UlaG (beta-lactamase superfamily)
MNKKSPYILNPLFFLLLFINCAFCQTGEIKIQFIGNCGFYMTDGDLNILVDYPYVSGAYGYMTYDKKKVKKFEKGFCLFTHGHADHWSRKAFKKLNLKLFAPDQVALGLSGKKKLKKKDFNQFKDFKFEAFITPHRFSIKHYSYLITWHKLKIYFTGDAENPDYLLSMKNLDIAIVNTWLLKAIKNQNKTIDAKKIIVCHHRTGEKVDAGQEFVKIEQYETISIKY